MHFFSQLFSAEIPNFMGVGHVPKELGKKRWLRIILNNQIYIIILGSVYVRKSSTKTIKFVPKYP